MFRFTCVNGISSILIDHHVLIYLEHDNIKIEIENSNYTEIDLDLELTDLIGNRILKSKITSGSSLIPFHDVAKGIYICNLSSKSGQRIVRKISK